MGLYKRGKTYWFEIEFDGHSIRKSLRTDNKKVADRCFAKVKTDLVEGVYFEKDEAKRHTFDEMSENYLRKYEHSRDKYTVKKLKPFFTGYTLHQIITNRTLIAEYQDMRSEQAKLATVYQELSLLRRMFNVAKKRWKWVRVNPVSDADLSFSVGNQNARDRWLTVDEERKLLEYATNPSWLRPLLITALHTGMRRGEILALDWTEVDFHRAVIRVEDSKNGEKRSIPMSKTLQWTLKNMRVRRLRGRIFPISASSLRSAFEKARGRAGIVNFHFHDTRHTFATRLIQNGVDLYAVQKLLGHKFTGMTSRYAHHDVESLRPAVEVLDKIYDTHNFPHNWEEAI